MINNKNLQILLKDSPVIRLKEDGEFLVCDLLIFSKAEFVEILDLQIELIRYFPQNGAIDKIYKIQSDNAHNYLESYKNVGMVLEFGLFEIHPIKNIIDRFKSEVYTVAKALEIESDPENKISDDLTRRRFLAIKEAYVNEVMSQIQILPGNYSIKVSLSFKTDSTSFSSDAQFIFANFVIEDYFPAYRIGVDNFLGRILSNILFSPSDPLQAPFPEYKSTNVILK